MIWYPYEQMKTMKAPYKILDAEGVHLYTKDQKLIDSISSWWCMIHGYKHPELTEAIKEQADRFCHVMLGGLTHEPVEKLSAKLQEFLPGDLDYCFFSDSGSVAVEVSLKMALQYNTNQGRKRPLVLALEHAYHGDTFKEWKLVMTRIIISLLTKKRVLSIFPLRFRPWRRHLNSIMTV